MKLYQLLLGNLFIFLLFVGVSALIGAFAWPYAINSWLAYAGKAPCVQPVHGALLGLVPGFGYLSVPVAAVTWIAMLFLVAA